MPKPSPTGLLDVVRLSIFLSNTNKEDSDSDPTVYSARVSTLLPVSQLYAVRRPDKKKKR